MSTSGACRDAKLGHAAEEREAAICSPSAKEKYDAAADGRCVFRCLVVQFNRSDPEFGCVCPSDGASKAR